VCFTVHNGPVLTNLDFDITKNKKQKNSMGTAPGKLSSCPQDLRRCFTESQIFHSLSICSSNTSRRSTPPAAHKDPPCSSAAAVGSINPIVHPSRRVVAVQVQATIYLIPTASSPLCVSRFTYASLFCVFCYLVLGLYSVIWFIFLTPCIVYFLSLKERR
jgi:hypothetical protein